MKNNWFDKLHVGYRVFIILAVITAAILGWAMTSSFTYICGNEKVWVPMPWPPDMVPHPHPPPPPPPPPGGPIV